MVVRAASSRRRARRARLFAMHLFAVCLLVHVSSRAARARGVEEDAKTHRTDADADADASVPPLTRAVSDGNLPEVIALLKSLPESCDARTAYGETALHVASIEARGDVLAALLRACGTRAFVDARTRGGRYLKMTALHWMVHGGTKAHEEGMEALLRAGADATLRNEEGATAADHCGLMHMNEPCVLEKCTT